MYVLYRQHNYGHSYNGVLNITTSGNYYWNHPVSTQNENAIGRFSRIITTPDGGCITCGATSYFPSQPFVVKLSSNGGAIVTGYKTIPGTTNKDAWVFYIDSLGTWPPVWEKMMGMTTHNNGRGEKIMKTSDGNYMLFASDNNGSTNNNPQLFKLNPNGNVLWSQTGYYNHAEFNISPCSITNNDEVLFCGTSSMNPNYARFTHSTSDGLFRAPKLFLPVNNAQNQHTSPTLKIDAQSNIHIFPRYWYQLCIDSNFNDVLINHVVDSDTIQIPNLNPNTTYYWRVKGFGSEMKTTQWSKVFNFTTGNGNIGISETNDSKCFVSIFPNPVQSTLNISYTLKEESHVTLKFFNVNGLLIDSKEMGFQEAGVYQYLWNRYDQPNGIYFVTLNLNHIQIHHKAFILQ